MKKRILKKLSKRLAIECPNVLGFIGPHPATRVHMVYDVYRNSYRPAWLKWKEDANCFHPYENIGTGVVWCTHKDDFNLSTIQLLKHARKVESICQRIMKEREAANECP